MSARISETLGRGFKLYVEGLNIRLRKSDVWSKNIGRGLALKSWLNPRHDTKTLDREFKSSAESFRCAARYLKFRYQTGCTNQPWCRSLLISFILPSRLSSHPASHINIYIYFCFKTLTKVLSIIFFLDLYCICITRLMKK